MKLLKHVPWALLVLVVLTLAAAAAHQHKGAAVPAPSATEPTRICEEGYSVAPSGNDLVSKYEPLTFCICLLGTNCCGDDGACPAGTCGKTCQCTCNGANQCVH